MAKLTLILFILKGIICLVLTAPQPPRARDIVPTRDVIGALSGLLKSRRPVIVLVDDTKTRQGPSHFQMKHNYPRYLKAKKPHVHDQEFKPKHSKPHSERVFYLDRSKYPKRSRHHNIKRGRSLVQILEVLRSRAPKCLKNNACRTLCDSKDDYCKVYCDNRFDCDDGLGINCDGSTSDCDAPDPNPSTRGYTERQQNNE